MRAVVIEEFGVPEVLALREVSNPTVGPDDVLVEVEFASVTFVETQIRQGQAPHPSMLPKLPAIPGNGVGGAIVAVGPSVDPGLVGARVVSSTGGTGGYAELASVPAEAVIPVPDGLAMSDAVALLADGRTAVGLVDQVGIRPGERVLVEAAAGGVGSLLVQLAKRAGATLSPRPVVPASSNLRARSGPTLRSTTAGRRGQARLPRPSAPPESTSFLTAWAAGSAAKRSGCSRGAADSPRLAWRRAASRRSASASSNDRDVTRVPRAVAEPGEFAPLSARALSLAAAGQLRPVVGQQVPLENAAEAHRAIEARTTIGKTLLTP